LTGDSTSYQVRLKQPSFWPDIPLGTSKFQQSRLILFQEQESDETTSSSGSIPPEGFDSTEPSEQEEDTHSASEDRAEDQDTGTETRSEALSGETDAYSDVSDEQEDSLQSEDEEEYSGTEDSFDLSYISDDEESSEASVPQSPLAGQHTTSGRVEGQVVQKGLFASDTRVYAKPLG